VGAVELVADKQAKTPFEPLGKVGTQADLFARGEGAILRNLADTIALSPPLVIDEDEVRRLVSMLAAALDRTLDWAQAEGLMA